MDDTLNERMDDIQKPEFGEAIRNEFMLRPNTVFLNHAAFGAMPRCVHERQIRYLSELESHPDNWFRFSMYKYLAESIRTVADFVGTAAEDIFLMQNATKVTNTVLKAFPMTSHDVILLTSWTYGSSKMAARITAERVKGKVHVMELTFPIHDEADILNKYENFLTEHTDVKLAIIDHITSPTSVLMPIKQLTEVCHKHDVLVIIDGAQAPGQLKLNLQDYDADFYIGNLHKWVYCPRGCAFLWRNPNRKHDWLKPLVTAAFEKDGLFKAFAYEGTKDDTPYLCSADGIRFYQRLGGIERITSYTTNLKSQAIEYLERTWHTKRIHVPLGMVPPNIELICLPFIPEFSNNPERFLELQNLIAEKFDVQSFVVNIQEQLYIRLSIQVYNTMEDVVKLGDVILKLSSGVNT